MARRYLVPMGAIAALYAANRFALAPLTGSRLLAWHGADFLAGALMLCFLNGLLELTGRIPLGRRLPVSAFALGCGLFWEVVTPLYLPRSVGDPRAVQAVWLGALANAGNWELTGRRSRTHARTRTQITPGAGRRAGGDFLQACLRRRR